MYKNLPASAAPAKLESNQTVIDPQAIEKQAYRLLAQVQQTVSMLADIVDALRKEIISRDDAAAATEAETGAK
jgi:hypothetical protein